MKNQTDWKRNHWCAMALGGAVTALAGMAILGHSDPPVLRLTHLSNNVYQIAITNPAVGVRYQIQRRDSLSPTNQWVWLIGGTNAQTNFVFSEGIHFQGFYQARTCVDCDSDWINGDQDGNDADPNILTLAVTIDDPANGTSIP